MTATTVIDGWSRNRLLTILVTAGVIAVAVVMGFFYAILFALTASGGGSGGAQPLTVAQANSSTALGPAHRDQIAAAPMLAVDPQAMYPGTPSVQVAGSLPIPTGNSVGADGVETGYPHTPQGAVAQLGAISQRVLTQMSVPLTQQIYTDWAMPGGVGPSGWVMTQNVTQFLGGAGMGTTLSPGMTVTAIPAGGQIKGTDGPDWALACVLLEVNAISGRQAAIGYGYCERMQWTPDPGQPTGGRWNIVPGTPPATAPNTWPGTSIAIRAGWLTWATSTRTAGS